ncbi:hypothetical protein cyc_07437 [Cyclospora cayetanensis]|uniref:PCI domain-containing protein n=1 Tax=Cyclospora cayetanensis TaxID=88456 RepID=A0A1D3DAD8_9EIME|nr:hypothetical protein cyc_07437 [Cyclospora cayetanensis]
MEEGYEFEFESNGGPWGPEQEAAVAVENLYYEAQDCLQAVHLLEEVVQREADVVHKPWTCKALLSLTLLALGEGNFDCAGAHYQRLLQQMPTVAAGEAAATVEAVLSAAAKLVGGQVLEKLMLYTLEALTSQGMKDDPTVRSAKALRTAFEASDIAGVEEHLQLLGATDPFVSHCREALLEAVRLRRLLCVASCYSAFSLKRLQQTLRLSYKATLNLVLQVIRQGRLVAVVDDEARVVRLRGLRNQDVTANGQLLSQWGNSLHEFIGRLETFLVKEPQNMTSRGGFSGVPYAAHIY